MESIRIDEGLTLKELVHETGAAPHVIRYLLGLGRLPILQHSAGAGYPVIYSPNAILIVKEHLIKSNKHRLTGINANKSE